MSYLKINSDEFLGSQELNRLVKFLDEDGFRKLFLKNSISFGLFHTDLESGEFDNFKISQGTNAGTIQNAVGYAIDNEGKIIYRPATDNVSLINDNQWYWIKIAHAYDSREVGIVSIDVNGNLTGDGTEFLATLRGNPNNPTRVRFEGAVLNIQEYDVHEVVDDENAVLLGDFLSESNLRLVVIGAFTPGTVTPSDSKEIFQYDGCTMTAVLETILNTPPTLIDDQEFVIARVKRNGVTISIEDKRSRNIYRSKEDFDLNTITQSTNPLVGIESVRFNNIRTPLNENIAYVAFSFRSSNWTIDSSVNRVTIIGGQGGIFKDTSYFTDGDFDGWRVYTKNGKYKIIRQSSISALQINLILDTLDPDDFNEDLTQELIITPNCDEVEIIAKVPVGESTLTEKRFSFPSNTGEAKILLPVYKATSCEYVISYRYKNFKTWSEETVIPNDVVGYYVESAFNSAGVLTGSTRFPYIDGTITLTESTGSYTNVIGSVTTGQLFGYEYLPLDNADPIQDIALGSNRENIIITQEDEDELSQDSDSDFDLAGLPFTLTADHYLNFSSENSNLRNGNEFSVEFRGTYILDGFTINIVQDYVNPGSPGILLYQLTAYDIQQAAVDNLVLKVFWDGTQWQVFKKVYVRDNSIGADQIQDASITSLKLEEPYVKINSGSPQLKIKELLTGDWNMNSTTNITIPHGLSNQAKIVGILAVKIRQDGGGSVGGVNLYPIDFLHTSADPGYLVEGFVDSVAGANIGLRRRTGGFWDSASFAATSYNRGIVYLMYVE